MSVTEAPDVMQAAALGATGPVTALPAGHVTVSVEMQAALLVVTAPGAAWLPPTYTDVVVGFMQYIHTNFFGVGALSTIGVLLPVHVTVKLNVLKNIAFCALGS